LVERPKGEAKRGLMSLKNSITARASILRPSISGPIAEPPSLKARRAASAQKATRERALAGLPSQSVIWPQPTRTGVRGSIISSVPRSPPR
jgi:hypothetical protein